MYFGVACELRGLDAARAAAARGKSEVESPRGTAAGAPGALGAPRGPVTPQAVGNEQMRQPGWLRADAAGAAAAAGTERPLPAGRGGAPILWPDGAKDEAPRGGAAAGVGEGNGPASKRRRRR